MNFKLLLAPLEDKPFKRLLVFLVFFTIAQVIAGPFFFYYGYETLQIPLLHMTLFGTVMAISSLASAPAWGYLSDKYGNKPVLFLAGVLLSIGPLSWSATRVDEVTWNYSLLVFGHICAGLAWTGVSTGQFNFILAVAKPELRANAIGLCQAITALIGGVAPLAAGFWLEFSKSFFEGPQAYTTLFFANGILRIAAVFLLIGIKDPTSSQIREFLRQVGGVRPKGVFAMKKLSEAETARQKQLAIRRIGDAGMKMAETELSRQLLDPSPRVRREAARALHKMGGQEAIAALVSMIERHPFLVDEEMVEALGAIGDESAVHSLVSLLENPSSALRRASAKALGRLRSPLALNALMSAAVNPDDKELRRAAIQALRLIGDPICEPVILKALQDAHPSVRVAAAEACTELILKNGVPILREQLCCDVDETFGELAYALGSLGTQDDARIILNAAAKMKAAIGRRRCLLAAANLFEVESIFYRILMMDSIQRDASFMALSKEDDTGGIRQAISLYHAMEEGDAVSLLASKYSDTRIALIEEIRPKDGFLLAAAILNDRFDL